MVDKSAAAACALKTKKAPKQRSCDGCRIRKIACSFRAESSERRSLPSESSSPQASSAYSTTSRSLLHAAGGDGKPCRACESKGINCIISNADVPFRRNRSGKRIRKALADSQTSQSSSDSFQTQWHSITSSTEQSLHLVAVSGRLGHLLIAVCADRPQQTLDCPPLCIPLFDQWSMQERFEAAGGRLDQLNSTDQQLCSIMLALGARMVPDSALGTSSRSGAFHMLSQRAEKLVDQNGTWHQCDPENIAVMIMMSQLLCDGDLASKAGRRYRRAAIANLEELDQNSDMSVEDRNNGYNDYLALLILDSASALEVGRPSMLPRDLITKFSRCKGLPQPDLLARLADEHRISCVGLINGVSLEYGGLRLWSVAEYCATLYTSARMQDNLLYRNLRAQLDAFDVWLVTVKQCLPQDVDISLYLDMAWCTRLLAEMRLLQALESVFASMCTNGEPTDGMLFPIALEAFTTSKQRFRSSLLSFIGHTAFNKNKINALALLSGTLWSVKDLQVFTSAYKDACQAGIVGHLNLHNPLHSEWLLTAIAKASQAYAKGKIAESPQSPSWPASVNSVATGSTASLDLTRTSPRTLPSGSTSVCSISSIGATDFSVPSLPPFVQPDVGDVDNRSSGTTESDFALMDSWIDWMQGQCD